MTTGLVLRVRADEPEPSSVQRAADALLEGELVVMPTETVYGIASRPDDPAATSKLFAAKRRPPRLNLPVLTASAHQAFELGRADERARALAERYWPGPLTLVLERAERSSRWNLGEEGSTIGLRVPDLLVALALLTATGPLAVTSANRSGSQPAATPEELVEAFGETVRVYLVLDEPPPAGDRAASTVVDLSGDDLRILRHGPIDAADVARVALGDEGTPGKFDSIH